MVVRVVDPGRELIESKSIEDDNKICGECNRILPQDFLERRVLFAFGRLLAWWSAVTDRLTVKNATYRLISDLCCRKEIHVVTFVTSASAHEGRIPWYKSIRWRGETHALSAEEHCRLIAVIWICYQRLHLTVSWWWVWLKSRKRCIWNTKSWW